ncbi:MAG: hypothetical protein ABI894_00195 [Ilumatobacteraceae bacterium]
MLRKLLVPLLIIATTSGTAVSVAYASHGHDDNNSINRELKRVKRATQQFRKLSVAQDAGYGLLLDKDGIACIDMPDMGAMGVHYAKGAIVPDGAIDPLTPEAVVYEPDEHGRLRLVALEYVVFKDAWDAQHASPPSLFGQEFNSTPVGNRFDLPAYYSLHVWLYKNNPAGMFEVWNPNVTCTPGNDDGQGDDHHGHHGDDHAGQDG